MRQRLVARVTEVHDSYVVAEYIITDAHGTVMVIGLMSQREVIL